MSINSIARSAMKLLEVITGAAPTGGRAEDGPSPELLDVMIVGQKPSAPKMERSDQKMADFLAAGASGTSGQEAAIRMLEGFIETTDSSLEGMGEFKAFGEGILSNLIGKPVSFPNDPTAAKEMAQQLLDELKGTPAPARVVRDEMGEVVETRKPESQTNSGSGLVDHILREEGRRPAEKQTGGARETVDTAPREVADTQEAAPAEEVGGSGLTASEIQDFIGMLDELAVPRSPYEMKALKDQTPQAEKDRMQAIHKKFVDAAAAGTLPPQVAQAYREKHAAIKANIDKVPAMFVTNKPDPLSSDPTEGIEQLYVFAESNA